MSNPAWPQAGSSQSGSPRVNRLWQCMYFTAEEVPPSQSVDTPTAAFASSSREAVIVTVSLA
jgi:hypothetical protein